MKALALRRTSGLCRVACPFLLNFHDELHRANYNRLHDLQIPHRHASGAALDFEAKRSFGDASELRRSFWRALVAVEARGNKKRVDEGHPEAAASRPVDRRRRARRVFRRLRNLVCRRRADRQGAASALAAIGRRFADGQEYRDRPRQPQLAIDGRHDAKRNYEPQDGKQCGASQTLVMWTSFGR